MSNKSNDIFAESKLATQNERAGYPRIKILFYKDDDMTELYEQTVSDSVLEAEANLETMARHWMRNLENEQHTILK